MTVAYIVTVGLRA